MSTYGNSGNRWWVGENIGETGSQSTVFGTPSLAALNPFTPSGYESLPSGNATDDALFAAAAAKNKGNPKPGTVNVENVNWFNIQGPYTTQAAANAAIPAIEKAVPSAGVLAQAAHDNASNPLGSGLSFAGTILNGFTAAIGGLSGTNILIRGAKMILWSVIMLIGLAKMTGLTQGIAGKAVKLAPLL